jgi:hypothetical protein
MPLAEWSGKAAVEHEQNMCFATEIGQVKRLPLEVGQGEIGGWGVDRNFGHQMPLYGTGIIKKVNSHKALSQFSPWNGFL